LSSAYKLLTDGQINEQTALPVPKSRCSIGELSVHYTTTCSC